MTGWSIDTCFYCGRQYHPMMIWAKNLGKRSGDLRHVCSGDWDDKIEQFVVSDVCEKKARADGFEPCPQLTPKR